MLTTDARTATSRINPDDITYRSCALKYHVLLLRHVYKSMINIEYISLQ